MTSARAWYSRLPAAPPRGGRTASRPRSGSPPAGTEMRAPVPGIPSSRLPRRTSQTASRAAHRRQALGGKAVIRPHPVLLHDWTLSPAPSGARCQLQVLAYVFSGALQTGPEGAGGPRRGGRRSSPGDEVARLPTARVSARLLSSVIRSGSWRGTPVLSAGTAEEITRPSPDFRPVGSARSTCRSPVGGERPRISLRRRCRHPLPGQPGWKPRHRLSPSPPPRSSASASARGASEATFSSRAISGHADNRSIPSQSGGPVIPVHLGAGAKSALKVSPYG